MGDNFQFSYDLNKKQICFGQKNFCWFFRESIPEFQKKSSVKLWTVCLKRSQDVALMKILNVSQDEVRIFEASRSLWNYFDPRKFQSRSVLSYLCNTEVQ